MELRPDAPDHTPSPLTPLQHAVRRLIDARDAGADGYELRAEIDDMEMALHHERGLRGAHCSVCGEPLSPRHLHIQPWEWVL